MKNGLLQQALAMKNSCFFKLLFLVYLTYNILIRQPYI